MIWLMGYNDALFERVNSYGYHAIQVSYANQWFGKLCQPAPKKRSCPRRYPFRGFDRRGCSAMRSTFLSRTRSWNAPDQFVKHLAEEHEDGRWKQFLTKDGKGLLWEKVTLSGARRRIHHGGALCDASKGRSRRDVLRPA